jgi:predicted RNase H-like nuclease
MVLCNNAQKYFGIDGCKGGWVRATVVEEQGITALNYATIEVATTLERLIPAQTSSPVLIDMPIGLPDEKLKTRACDQLARKLLGRRASSIFSPPTRKALACEEYQDACRVNAQLTDRKISKQSWNLKPKLLEVDAVATSGQFIESHPELCFTLLAPDIQFDRKRTENGRLQRLEILNTWVPNCQSTYETALTTYPRSQVAADDLIDAMVLALSAYQSMKYPDSRILLPEQAEFDQSGRKIQMQAWARNDQ